MNAINLFKNDVEYTIENVIDILKENNLFSVKLFYNCYGWNTYYTTEPTFATPTGVLYKEGFPAKVNIEAHNNYTKSVVKPIKFIK
jgi:hypothetical protein